MKKFIRNLLLALPLLFAVQVAVPATAEARSIVIRPIVVVYPRYEYRLVYVYGPYWANYGGFLTLVYGGHYEYQLVLVY
jgi:hypothetical protein